MPGGLDEDAIKQGHVALEDLYRKLAGLDDDVLLHNLCLIKRASGIEKRIMRRRIFLLRMIFNLTRASDPYIYIGRWQ